MVFFELRWNYSPLKEKAVLLPDGLFICFCRYAPHRFTFQLSLCAFLLLRRAARRPRASRLGWWWTKFVALLCSAPHRYFIRSLSLQFRPVNCIFLSALIRSSVARICFSPDVWLSALICGRWF